MSVNVHIRYLFCSALLILAFGISAAAQTKTCDLLLEVIQSSESEDAKEIQIKEAVASYLDRVTQRNVPAALNAGMPLFAKLASGKYLLTVTKVGHKTTTKSIDLDCSLSNADGVVSEVIMVWKGDPSEFRPMHSGGVTYGIVVDNSGSMRVVLDRVVAVTKEIAEQNPADGEMFLVRFVGRERIGLVKDFTKTKNDIRLAADNFFIEGGQTAMLDGLMFAAKHLVSRNTVRAKVLILISDGHERSSKTKIDDLLKYARENQIRIFVAGVAPENGLKKTLNKLTAGTGGTIFDFSGTTNPKPQVTMGGKRFDILTAMDIRVRVKELSTAMYRQ